MPSLSKKIARIGPQLSNILLLVISLMSLGLLIYNFGVGIVTRAKIQLFFDFSLVAFFVGYLLRMFFNFKSVRKESSRQGLQLFLFLWLAADVFVRFILVHFYDAGGWTEHTFSYIILFIVSIIEISGWSFYLLDRAVPPALLFVFSFLFIILTGALLLMLPNATVHGIRFLDALFTSTSAVCVTGLIVLDTAKDFTFFGKTIILSLIQIGGIGMMTFTTFFAFFLTDKSTFHNRMVLKDMISEDNLNNIFKTLVKIVSYTFIIEAIGAAFVFYTIRDTFSGANLWDQIGFSIFHAISAFCNAGFSTLSSGLGDPGTIRNYSLHTVIAFLIIVGGIGFPILFNYANLLRYYVRNRFRQFLGHQKAYIHAKILTINTRLAVITTFVLLAGGTLFFFVMEYNHILHGLTFMEKLATSFFASVTPRTAGFNTFSFSACLQPTLIFTIALMWVGASPMSTGGGVKTTSLALMVLNVFNTMRGCNKIEISGREVAQESVSRSHSVMILSLIWLTFAIFCLSITETNKDLLTISFECVSALSTVGLSLDYTAGLSDAGRIIIIITMFVGRVGLLTILIGITKKVIRPNYSYPKEIVQS